MKRLHIIVLLLIFIALPSLFAQKPTGVPLKKQEEPLNYFEKVYLHLDRHFYSPGDNVWFKAYLVNARSNKISGNSSKNLYVELISPASQLINREVLRIDYGVATGDFKLSDTLQSGKYRIRAYTKWMMNFGDAFTFEREISVLNTNAKKSLPRATETPRKFELKFFPEGGAMIEGVENVVAFKAYDHNGKGCDVKGTVVSSSGETLTWFQSQNLGMGKFSFKPENGNTYYANCIFNNDTVKVGLPIQLKKGFALRINISDSLMTIVVAANQPAFREFEGKKMVLTIQRTGTSRRLFSIPINKALVINKIRQSDLPAGLLRLILSDSIGRPHCERLVFNEQQPQLNVSITTDKPAYTPHQQTLVKLKITDKQNQPVRAGLSLSVTDAGVIPNPTINIESYLSLESEIRGKIEQPTIYFDS
ncbi:MAG: MG2 domain-containing protein, partial [Mariniphaga sp.]